MARKAEARTAPYADEVMAKVADNVPQRVKDLVARLAAEVEEKEIMIADMGMDVSLAVVAGVGGGKRGVGRLSTHTHTHTHARARTTQQSRDSGPRLLPG